MYEGHMFGFGGGFMWIFWILLIVAIVWAAKVAGGNRKNPPENQKSALDILKERYARGGDRSTGIREKAKRP
jgi:putative membrane protein